MPSSVEPIQNETITEGGDVNLSCQASGIPSPIMSWIKVGGQRINGSELVLTNINRNEAGEYRCEASNECGNASETATIDVQCEFFFLTFYNVCELHFLAWRVIRIKKSGLLSD